MQLGVFLLYFLFRKLYKYNFNIIVLKILFNTDESTIWLGLWLIILLEFKNKDKLLHLKLNNKYISKSIGSMLQYYYY